MNSNVFELDKALECHKSGNFQEAESIYNRILSQNPNDDTVLFQYGLLLSQLGNDEGAINLILKAIQIEPKANYYKDLANMYIKLDLKTEALDCYTKALQLDPFDSGLFYSIGILFVKENEYNQALKCFKAAYDLAPESAEINYMLAATLHTIGNIDDSIQYYENAVKLCPDNFDANYYLGAIYYEKEQFDKAVKYLKSALRLNPQFLETYKILGNIYALDVDINEAIAISLQGLQYFPDNDALKLDYTRALFTKGDLDKGWEYFRYRRIINERAINKPYLLDYNGSLEGKTVYVYQDAAFGDTIQFLRNIRLLHEKGARVLYKIQPELEQLALDSNLGGEVVSNSLPDEDVQCDFHINIISVTYMYKCSRDNFPLKDRYLYANPDKAKDYKEKYFDNDGLKVGIVWQASNYRLNRTIPHIKHLFPILEIPEVKFYSLQVGKGTEQLSDLPENIEIVNLGKTFKDFSDTAAAIENLDLLIGVDTCVPHLAGAMGKPAWIIMPYYANWRWFTEGENTPWYSSVRLFRQKTPNEWEEQISQIAAELSKK